MTVLKHGGREETLFSTSYFYIDSGNVLRLFQLLKNQRYNIIILS